MTSFISVTDLAPADLASLINRSLTLARTERLRLTLEGLTVGTYFQVPSTRTRTAFWCAARRLGAEVIAYGRDELQLATGESLADTGRVLSEYLDALVVRTNGDIAEMRQIGECGRLAVVNALSCNEHPTQAVADLSVVAEEFGELAGRHILYVGEGNSTAAALALSSALAPDVSLTVVSPPGYGLPKSVTDHVMRIGAADRVRQCLSLDSDLGQFDAVYTSRWLTMGVPKEDAAWYDAFRGYQVNSKMLESVAGPRTIFLHDLPAVREQEVTSEVIDSAASRVWRQSYYKMISAMAILEWCLLGS